MREVAGNQREIGVGVLPFVLAVVLVPGLLTAGCYYPSPTFTPPMPCDPGNDATCPHGMTCSAQGFCEGTDTDAGSDRCFGTEPFHVCLLEAPTQSLNISQQRTINTDTAADCAATNPRDSQGCVLAATTITIDATLRALGSRPLVLIASKTIMITPTGSIDVGSHRGATPELGAGAEPSQGCSSGQPPDDLGGGAGGSFLGLGGTGGRSVFVDNIGGTPGPVTAASKLRSLRGGCAGQGTNGQTATPMGGGHGGGAVLLIAGQSISVASGGAINAAGEGGEGGSVSAISGGGGGGSGGMIVLDAPTIESHGLILASGGGGGGGSSFGSTTTTPGKPGADPSAVSGAAGGPGSPDGGGSGGGGSSAATAEGGNGVNGISNGGAGRGGGGGGGAGIVKAPGMATLDSVSPTPTPTP